VDVGVASTKVLSTVKLSDLERMGFRKQLIDFLYSMTAKIIERSPLKYPVVRAVSCFVPSTILNNRSLAVTRLRDLLQMLFMTNHINAVTADNSKCQFSSLCDEVSGDYCAKFSTFSTSMDRLDTFYYNTLGDKADFTDLFSVIRLISHGRYTEALACKRET